MINGKQYNKEINRFAKRMKKKYNMNVKQTFEATLNANRVVKNTIVVSEHD